jgi:hypothetical protein
MFFTLGGVTVITGLRNGFGFDLAGNNGYIVKVSEDISDEDVERMRLTGEGKGIQETTGIMLLLPFVYVTVQWCV